LACSDGDINQISNLVLKKQLKRIKRHIRNPGKNFLYNGVLFDTNSFSNQNNDKALIYKYIDKDNDYNDNEYYISDDVTPKLLTKVNMKTSQDSLNTLKTVSSTTTTTTSTASSITMSLDGKNFNKSRFILKIS